MPRTLVAATVSALVLAACGSDTNDSDDTESPTATDAPTETAGPTDTPTEDPTQDPPPGDAITGNGYSFALPDGWVDGAEEIGGAGIDTAALESEEIEGFSNNVNIIVNAIGQEFTAQELLDAQVSELQGLGSIEDSGTTQFAGEDASYAVVETTQSGVDYRVYQFFVERDTTVYVITFSFRPSTDEAERTDIIRTIESGFAWQ